MCYPEDRVEKRDKFYISPRAWIRQRVCGGDGKKVCPGIKAMISLLFSLSSFVCPLYPPRVKRRNKKRAPQPVLALRASLTSR
jgi:hypothetical protein